MKQHSLILTTTLLIVSGVYFRSTAVISETSDICFKKTLGYLREGIQDSAIHYMQKAFSTGISDDSLYYLWSQIYIQKGILDTALALNFASSPPFQSAIHNKILKQRCSIYQMLGWKEEAGSILDSLQKNPAQHLKNLIPSAGIYFEGGGYKENEIEKKIPFNNETVLGSYTSMQGNFTGYLKWKIPLSSSQGLKTSLQYSGYGSHFTEPVSISSIGDSLDHTISAGLRYYLFSEQISLGYKFSRTKNLYNNLYLLNKFDLGFFLIRKLWSVFMECGLNFETREPASNIYGFLLIDRSFSEKNGLSFSLNSFYHSTDPLSGLDTNKVHLKYVDGFQFYSDSTFKDTLLTPAAMRDLIRGNQPPTMFVVKYPLSYINLNPAVSFRQKTWWDITFGIGAGYILTMYRGDYVWTDYRYSRDNMSGFVTQGEDYNILVMNRADRKMYWVRNIDFSAREMVLDSVPVVFRRKNRVDNTLTLNVNFKRNIGKFAEICLSGDISRNFSNLEDQAPVEIPSSDFRFMLTFGLMFDPAFLKE